MTSITWRGREVEHPVLRWAVLAFVIPACVVLMMLAVVLITVSIPFLVFVAAVSLPIHFILLATGRNGFLTREGNSLSYNVSRSGFRRRND